MGGRAKTGRGRSLSTVERRGRLMKALLDAPFGAVNVAEQARKLGVNESTIYRDLEALAEEVPRETAKHLVLRVMGGLDKAEAELRKLMRDKNPFVRLGAVNSFLTKHRMTVELAQRLGLEGAGALPGTKDNPLVVMGFDPSAFPDPMQASPGKAAPKDGGAR